MEQEEKWNKDTIHAALSDASVQLHYIFYNVPREKELQRPTPETWSPLEILIHLRQVGQVYAERVKRVVDQEEGDEPPLLYDYDEQKQMEKVDLQQETVKHNLGAFMQARSELLNKISFLEEDDWDELKCEHAKEGIISLKELLIPLVEREKVHIAQTKKLLEA